MAVDDGRTEAYTYTIPEAALHRVLGIADKQTA